MISRLKTVFSRMRPGDAQRWMARILVETALPASCPACAGVLEDQRGGICGWCWKEVTRAAYRHGGRLRMRGAFPATLTSLGAYEGTLKKIIACLKFAEMPAIGIELGGMLAGRVDSLPGGFDAVVPVPLHWRRRWSRGYNQSEMIARQLARRSGRPLLSRVLARARATETQTARSRRARAANVRGAFVIRSRQAVTGSGILLVDDVMTTGATISECARVLKAAGADTVHAATAARTFSQG